MEITCLDLSDKTAKTIKIISPRSAMISLIACDRCLSRQASMLFFFLIIVKIILMSLLPTQNVVFVYRVHMRRRSITSINQPKSLFCLWVRGIMPAEAKTKAKFISFWPRNINCLQFEGYLLNIKF